nr:uncharacterized protein LOC120968281 [Aegilops tauschii subsp. strangulata]
MYHRLTWIFLGSGSLPPMDLPRLRPPGLKADKQRWPSRGPRWHACSWQRIARCPAALHPNRLPLAFPSFGPGCRSPPSARRPSLRCSALAKILNLRRMFRYRVQVCGEDKNLGV